MDNLDSILDMLKEKNQPLEINKFVNVKFNTKPLISIVDKEHRTYDRLALINRIKSVKEFIPELPKELNEELIPKEPDEEIIIIKRKPKTTEGVKPSRIKKLSQIIPPNVREERDLIEMMSANLPKKEQPQIRDGQIMNNRIKFVSYINELFSKYKDESGEQNISCDDITANVENFSLLVHQQLVKDYINIFTPYRGLLLYHGLGSGKTCTSIAIAEGMKSHKQIIIMTPASLVANYKSELKKCGDEMYKKNHYWEWVSTDPLNIIAGDPTISQIDANQRATYLTHSLSQVLGLSSEYIHANKGAWLININNANNYNKLNENRIKPIIRLNRGSELESLQNMLNTQIEMMIDNKYRFINYDGLSKFRYNELTNNRANNIFNGAVIIIDEAHNFISRIVNKLSIVHKTKSQVGLNELSVHLYNDLLSSENSRIVLLTGTPIINKPNEISVLFNILRGYIKSWKVNINSNRVLNNDMLNQILKSNKHVDYFDYVSGELTFTRTPVNFSNSRERSGVEFDDNNLTDAQFVKSVTDLLQQNSINVEVVNAFNDTALPAPLQEFTNNFISKDTTTNASFAFKNANKFKARIIGLTSYFRSAQEELLPRFDKETDFQVEVINMSNYQFQLYETMRQIERQTEKSSDAKINAQGVFVEPKSSYKIYSRAYCNYAMEGRPMIAKNEPILAAAEEKLEEGDEPILNNLEQIELRQEGDELGGEVDEDDILSLNDDESYMREINAKLDEMAANPDEFLRGDGLLKHSPKFAKALDNIIRNNIGNQLVYSNFRSFEGIAIFKLVLDANGFAQFKVRKNGANLELDIAPEDIGKPKYILYTGKEKIVEREMLRKIYNGDLSDNLIIPMLDKIKLIALYNSTDSKSQQVAIMQQYRDGIINPAINLLEANLGNATSEIIKIIIISKSGSEGINLKNTRYVHIMEPYWNPVRIEQVIGRARRICSHKDLPEELRSVEVFLYLMQFTKQQIDSEIATSLRQKDRSKFTDAVFTSDQMLYEISVAKETVSGQILKAIKESAIDCEVYNGKSKENLQCFTFHNANSNSIAYKPNVEQDPDDITAQLNQPVQTWRGRLFTFNGKQYIRQPSTPFVYDKQMYDASLARNSAALKPVGEIRMIRGNETLQLYKKL